MSILTFVIVVLVLFLVLRVVELQVPLTDPGRRAARVILALAIGIWVVTMMFGIGAR